MCARWAQVPAAQARFVRRHRRRAVARNRMTISAIVLAAACSSLPRAGSEVTTQRPVLSEAQIVRSVLAGLMAELMPPAAVCLAYHGWQGPQSTDMSTEDVRTLGDRVVPESQCPPTYATMVVVVDSAGRPVAARRPAGYVDPHHVAIWKPLAVEPGRWLVRAEVAQGMGGARLYCEVQVDRPEDAKCAVFSAWVH